MTTAPSQSAALKHRARHARQRLAGDQERARPQHADQAMERGAAGHDQRARPLQARGRRRQHAIEERRRDRGTGAVRHLDHQRRATATGKDRGDCPDCRLTSPPVAGPGRRARAHARRALGSGPGSPDDGCRSPRGAAARAGAGRFQRARRQALGPGQRCRTTAPVPPGARPRTTRACRSSSLSASHRKKPRPATSAAAAGQAKVDAPTAELGREIAGHRLPWLGWTGAPELPPAAGDPLLRRKGGRDQSALEPAAREAGGDLAGGVAAQEGIDLLVGEIGATQRAKPFRGLPGRIAGVAVEGEAAGSASTALRSQNTGSGPSRRDSGAALSSAPVRSSATIRTRIEGPARLTRTGRAVLRSRAKV